MKSDTALFHHPDPDFDRLSQDGLRNLKCSLTIEEFSALRWAGQRTLRTNGEPLKLAETFRLALFNHLRAVVVDQVKKNKPVPPNIADMVQTPWE